MKVLFFLHDAPCLCAHGWVASIQQAYNFVVQSFTLS